ncbi:MAG TPA: hypothetical protein VK149_12495 [Sideroxyarcus sp.]|nr:hypothetical protein [Sideroxyarcus sp.]
MSATQSIPLHRVRLSLAFIVGNLQLKPLCGWTPNIHRWRFAISKRAAA